AEHDGGGQRERREEICLCVQLLRLRRPSRPSQKGRNRGRGALPLRPDQTHQRGIRKAVQEAVWRGYLWTSLFQRVRPQTEPGRHVRGGDSQVLKAASA